MLVFIRYIRFWLIGFFSLLWGDNYTKKFNCMWRQRKNITIIEWDTYDNIWGWVYGVRSKEYNVKPTNVRIRELTFKELIYDCVLFEKLYYQGYKEDPQSIILTPKGYDYLPFPSNSYDHS